VQSPGSGNTSPDATGVGTGNPSVRAERDGGNDGRVYHIAFTATGAGGSCTGTVTVGVPKSQGNNGGPVDQGALYDSTLPSLSSGAPWKRRASPPAASFFDAASSLGRMPPLQRSSLERIPTTFPGRYSVIAGHTPHGKENPIVKTKLVYALLLVLLLVGSSASLLARGFSGNCSGTYLMAEAGGATSLWTLEADGTFFATSSLQGILKFSDQQGSWEKDGNDGLKGAVLALVFDDDGSLLNVSRVDMSLHTVGNGCDNIAGSLEVREFTGSEDPLDPTTDTGEPIATDTVTGRRVKPRG
jgi:hypothetical protein